MPAEVLEVVQPLQIWPGRELVAFTAYAYRYCDNDSYNEVALSIVTNKPGSANLGPVSLIGQSLTKDLWGYVLKLPVDTELAEVRGVVGYNLPKWQTGIYHKETAESVVFELIDQATGKVDVTFTGAKLADLSDEVELVTNSFTNIGHDGALSYGYAVSRQQRHASSTSAEAVTLELSGGSLSAYIAGLKLGKMLRYEYVPAFQSALYAPEPLQKMLARVSRDRSSRCQASAWHLLEQPTDPSLAARACEPERRAGRRPFPLPLAALRGFDSEAAVCSRCMAAPQACSRCLR